MERSTGVSHGKRTVRLRRPGASKVVQPLPQAGVVLARHAEGLRRGARFPVHPLRRYKEVILDIVMVVSGFLSAIVLPIIYVWVHW
jgi:hypothetical protein